MNAPAFVMCFAPLPDFTHPANFWSEFLSLDFETYSTADLKKVGAHAYAEHPSTDVTTLAWAFGAEKPAIWYPGLPFPQRVVDHVLAGGRICAWNAQFERLIWRHVLGPRYGVPVPHLRQYECTMVRSFAMGLPGSLEKAGIALRLAARKDMGGKAAMLLTCKPGMVTEEGGHHKSFGRIPRRKPYLATYATLDAYCITDVEVEQAAGRLLLHLKPSEQELYWLDQEVNDRGKLVDVELVDAAAQVVEQSSQLLDRSMKALTVGKVPKTSRVADLKRWLELQGVPTEKLESLDKDSVEKLLKWDGLPSHARRAVEIRQEAGKSSTAKLVAYRAMLCADGTIKGGLQFHGASTGRDAGRGLQEQNFPRPEIQVKDYRTVMESVRTGDGELVSLLVGKPLTAVADTLRNMIVAPPGSEMFSGDLSQIEARTTKTLAGQWDGVEAFKAYDRGKGPDIYIVAASGIFGVPPASIDKKDPRRQLGKVSELALGFAGGAEAFASMAKVYRIELDPMFDTVWPITPEEIQEQAIYGYESRGARSSLSERAWLAAEAVKIAWRQANPDIVQFWKDVEDAAGKAIAFPGNEYDARGFKFKVIKSVLRLRLLSGRCLYYPFPALVEKKTGWTDNDGNEVWKETIKYEGLGPNNQWGVQYAYGGFFVQNIVQATARDVIFEALLRLERLGYRNIMRVHDELVMLREAGRGDEAQFRAELERSPVWCPELPVAADVWRGGRYKK